MTIAVRFHNLCTVFAVFLCVFCVDWREKSWIQLCNSLTFCVDYLWSVADCTLS